MEYDLLITGLKVAGVLVGSALGIAGVLFNFKSENGRLTKSGIAVILGILTSSILGVIGSLAEGHKAKLEALEQTKQIHQLLSELNRSMHPITKLEVAYWVKLPKVKQIQHIIDQTTAFVDHNLEQLLDFSSPSALRTVEVNSIDMNDTPLSVSIKPRSTFWPDDNLGLLISTFRLSVYILKTPIDPEEFRPIVSAKEADFIGSPSPKGGAIQLQLDISEQELYIVGMQETPTSITKSGRISTIPDLYGAQLFLVAPSGAGYKFGPRREQDETVAEVTQLVELRTVAITIAEGREIRIDGDKFEKTKSKHGDPVFSIVLPETEDGMRGLFR